ncbi:hypothetical protein J1C67_07935 [Clostridium gasigenes]|nr:hypothetical protein [Clostridium gasigenes]QSW21021.1 hypothetical protein J1C67_07935 [Clostridium gasigenes]
MKFAGIKRFEELLVYGTGFIEEDKQKAVEKAIQKIDGVITEVWRP